MQIKYITMKTILSYSILTLLLFGVITGVGEAQTVDQNDIEKAYERFYEAASNVKETQTISSQKEFLFSAIELFSLQYKETQSMVEKQSFISEKKREILAEEVGLYKEELEELKKKLKRSYGSYEIYDVSKELSELRESYKNGIQKDILLTYISSFESSVTSPLRERTKSLSIDSAQIILRNIDKIETVFNEVKDVFGEESFNMKEVREKIEKINTILKETYRQFRDLSIRVKEERIGVGIFE